MDQHPGAERAPARRLAIVAARRVAFLDDDPCPLIARHLRDLGPPAAYVDAGFDRVLARLRGRDLRRRRATWIAAFAAALVSIAFAFG